MITPALLTEQINKVSDEYFELSQELASIAERKGTAWLDMRKSCKTNAETEQLWAASPDGRRESYLKIYLKGLEKKRGALILEWKSNNGTL